ncbi:thioredoxin family protein [Reichenbachiella versicolor]|uniref:thioredoxin family protein n=1 Tax=Reichenbachiella versicolor TaxID=1821036 RepID=UPI000D6DD3E7|nr:thioredoxin family protein [Reichenbachiella versicolor]
MKSFIITILTLFAFSATAQYKIGDIATDFSLKGTDDKMHSLADFKNAKGYIVIFTCNHCPYSVAYEDRIIALQSKYGSLYPVIAINPNDPRAYEIDSFENMKVRAKEKGFNFPYLFDDGQKIFPQYGATKTPHVFLLDKNRKVQYIGAIDDSTQPEGVEEKFVENAIADLEAGKKPKTNYTKAIGCSIKTI